MFVHETIRIMKPCHSRSKSGSYMRVAPILGWLLHESQLLSGNQKITVIFNIDNNDCIYCRVMSESLFCSRVEYDTPRIE